MAGLLTGALLGPPRRLLAPAAAAPMLAQAAAPQTGGGLLSMFAPQAAQSPFYQAFDQRRDTITNMLLGGVGAETPLERMRGMAAGVAEGRKSDASTRQVNQTAQWLSQQFGLSPEDAFVAVRNPDVMRFYMKAKGGTDASYSQTPVFLTDPEGNQHIGQMSSSGGILLNGQTVNSLPDGWRITARPDNFSTVDMGGYRGVFNPNTGTYGAGPAIQGSPSANMDVTIGPDGTRQMAPAQGSPEAVERQQAEAARLNAARQADDRTAFIVNSINDAISKSTWATTGMLGTAGRAIGFTKHVELESAVDVVKANLGFNELQQMREASPTGGALGQVTERELALLQSTVTSLDVRQGEAQLDKNLRLVQNLLMRQQVYREIDRLGLSLESPEAQSMLAQFPLPTDVSVSPHAPSSGVDLKTKYGLD